MSDPPVTARPSLQRAVPAGGVPWIVRLAESAVADVRTVSGAAEFLEGAMPGVTVVRGLGLPGQLLVDVGAAVAETADVGAVLAAVPGVAWAHPDFQLNASLTPNDPLYGSLYGLHNTGQSGGTAGADIDAAAAVSNADFSRPSTSSAVARSWRGGPGFKGMDDVSPKAPTGHADGIRTSTWLTQSVKQTHRKHAMNIPPQDVIDVLIAAGVKNWVLMGLHGYVGYLPEPRATQNVDVMVPFGWLRSMRRWSRDIGIVTERNTTRATSAGWYVLTTTASPATICGSWRIGAGTGPARKSTAS